MEDYLVGKCYHTINTLLYVDGPFDYVLYSVCKKLIKLTEGIGYMSDTDILYLNPNDFVKVDPIIWNKIHKILNINTIACNTILQSCKEYESPTGYYVNTFSTYHVSTSSTKMYYKLFEVLKDSKILTRFNNNQVWIKELKEDAVKLETMFSTSRKWISPETYNKVKDNVKNTIEEIDDIWLTMLVNAFWLMGSL